MIRVVLLDDHPIVLDGIAHNLQDAGIDVVGRAANSADGIEVVRKERPDVLVLDLQLQEDGGVDVLVQSKREFPDLRVVVFTAYGGRGRISRVLEDGADSFVLKGTSSQHLITAIEAAARGERYLPNDVAAELIDAMREPTHERLTPRERQIVRLLSRGLSNRSIASELQIAERTVKFHVSEVFARLGVSNRTQAVAKARELGFE